MHFIAAVCLLLTLVGVGELVFFIFDCLQGRMPWRRLLLFLLALATVLLLKHSTPAGAVLKASFEVSVFIILLTIIGGLVTLISVFQDRRRRIRLERVVQMLFPGSHYKLVSTFKVRGLTLGTYLEVGLENCALRIQDEPGIDYIRARSRFFIPCQPKFDLFLLREGMLACLSKSFWSELTVGDKELDSTFCIGSHSGAVARRFLRESEIKELLLDIFSDSSVHYMSLYSENLWSKRLDLLGMGACGIALTRYGLLNKTDEEKESLGQLIEKLVALRVYVASPDG